MRKGKVVLTTFLCTYLIFFKDGALLIKFIQLLNGANL